MMTGKKSVPVFAKMIRRKTDESGGKDEVYAWIKWTKVKAQ